MDDAHQAEGRTDEAQAWTALAYLLSGPLVYGGAGWALDVWLGTRWLLPVGIVLGMAAAVYLVYVRYGR